MAILRADIKVAILCSSLVAISVGEVAVVTVPCLPHY